MSRFFTFNDCLLFCFFFCCFFFFCFASVNHQFLLCIVFGVFVIQIIAILVPWFKFVSDPAKTIYSNYTNGVKRHI